MNTQTLVQPLFAGPVDVVADVHGEFDALLALLGHLGYGRDGQHTEGRRLVFVGDLTDRGMDSPAVVALVADLMSAGLAQCVLGNHELNLLRGEQKHGNAWFHGRVEALDRGGAVVPQVLADAPTRARALALFRRFPLALERDDLRVVHACWSPASIDQLRGETEVLAVFQQYQERIEEDLRRRGVVDPSARELALQNDNPVKVLTSGPERPAARPYEAGGRVRGEERVPWWDDYRDPAWCVFGHYWRLRRPGEDGEYPFGATPLYAPLGNGKAMCIDYSVGKRWHERAAGVAPPDYQSVLTALRWPEKVLVLDNGSRIPLE